MTLCELFHASVTRYASHVAIHDRGRDWTYEELCVTSRKVAAWLQTQGLKGGDRVALLMPNSAEYVATYFGILLAGGVAVPLNPDTTPQELSDTLNHCMATTVVVTSQTIGHFESALANLTTVRALLCTAACAPVTGRSDLTQAVLADLSQQPSSRWSPPSVGLNNVAQIIYTSGTSGRPKGVALSHGNLSANCRSIIQYLDLTSADSVFVILPFFYSYGNSLLLTHIAAGGRLILAPDFVFWNRALDLMEQQGATGFSGVPSSYAMLLHKSNFERRAFPRLRYITCAGGGLAPAVVQRLRSVLPHVRIFLMYGQTEAAARLSTLMPEDLDAKVGSIGKGIPGVTLSVLTDANRPVAPGEVGEIVAQGENVMLGYWNDPEETRRVLRPEGLRTGDLATVDEDGFLYVVGRKSDMIKSGGYRINPKEIEEVIMELDGVSEVAVAGHEDEILGEVPVAFVVPSSNGKATSMQDVLDHCSRRLARYKMIREVRFVTALPRTSSGKIKRRELRGLFQDPVVA